jgi:hypothetical protein
MQSLASYRRSAMLSATRVNVKQTTEIERKTKDLIMASAGGLSI